MDKGEQQNIDHAGDKRTSATLLYEERGCDMIPTPPNKRQGKITDNLPRIQQEVYNLLANGGKYSAADISICLHLGDPRGHIAELRKKGIPILDEWQESEYGTRYKVYFIKQEEGK